MQSKRSPTVQQSSCLSPAVSAIGLCDSEQALNFVFLICSMESLHSIESNSKLCLLNGGRMRLWEQDEKGRVHTGLQMNGAGGGGGGGTAEEKQRICGCLRGESAARMLGSWLG